jgi:hypothetical protein
MGATGTRFGVLGPLHRPGTQLERLPSAALLGPFAPALTFYRPPIFLMLKGDSYSNEEHSYRDELAHVESPLD